MSVKNPWNNLLTLLSIFCSAGVGRTGTFIGLDIVLERLESLHQETINIYETISYLRTRRVNMIQTVVRKFIFLYIWTFLKTLLYGAWLHERKNNLNVEWNRNLKKKNAETVRKPCLFLFYVTQDKKKLEGNKKKILKQGYEEKK